MIPSLLETYYLQYSLWCPTDTHSLSPTLKYCHTIESNIHSMIQSYYTSLRRRLLLLSHNSITMPDVCIFYWRFITFFSHRNHLCRKSTTFVSLFPLFFKSERDLNVFSRAKLELVEFTLVFSSSTRNFNSCNDLHASLRSILVLSKFSFMTTFHIYTFKSSSATSSLASISAVLDFASLCYLLVFSSLLVAEVCIYTSLILTYCCCMQQLLMTRHHSLPLLL